MLDYIAAVQRILVNNPQFLILPKKVWTEDIPNTYIALGFPEPYVISADSVEMAYSMAVDFFEVDYPIHLKLPDGVIENFLVNVRTPSTNTDPTQTTMIALSPDRLRTPILEPYHDIPNNRWLWQRTDIVHGPTIPGPCHLNKEWFEKLIDGETIFSSDRRSAIQAYFTREHAIQDAIHARAPIKPAR